MILRYWCVLKQLKKSFLPEISFSDEFSINSELGVGTTVVSAVYVHSAKEEK
jgi:hypothetical protein